MTRYLSAIFGALALTACGSADEQSAPTQRIAFEETGEHPLGAGTPPPEGACPPGSPADRPEGSNCMGILPDTCGADRAARFVGEELTAGMRGRLDAMSGSTTRYLEEDSPQSEDLDGGRLNIILDREGRIERVDCY